MSQSDNKQLIERIYQALSAGNSAPFVEALADDVRWTMMGTTSWSGIYDGKQAVLTELLRPLRAQWADRYTASAERVVADGDIVVAQVRGRVTTVAGERYDNSYCFIFRIAGGKIREMTEYLDTDLVNRALAPREASA
jgi:ketosteroid isomerase-like protein